MARFLLIVAVFCVRHIHAQRPRGVRPEMAGFYDPADQFHCLDGSATIPFDHVNDDYCDCRDGTDEPGTSACSAGTFYCQNKKFKPSIITSSRVNDGICDCCDGSDEWAANTPCDNNCLELGAADRAERERLAAIIEKGLEAKRDMAQRGKALREEKQASLATAKAELDGKKAGLDELDGKKSEAESLEKAALDVIREEEDRKRAEQEEKERHEKEAEARRFFHAFDSNTDGVVDKSELQNEIAFDQDNDGLVSDEEVEFFLSGHESYDEETFVSTGWLLIRPRIVSSVEENDEVVSQGEAVEISPPAEGETGDAEDYKDETFDDDDTYGSDDDYEDDVGDSVAPDSVQEIPDSSKYSPEVQALVDAANAARDAYNQAKTDYDIVDRQIKDLERTLENDFGPNDVYADLHGQCFEYHDLEYTYRMCMFDQCYQKPLNGGSETRLGSWDSWSVPYTEMSFTNGASCWNGPVRSTKVDVECGETNELVGASEPNRCEYNFKFVTPAACDEHHVADSHDEL